MNLKWAWVAGAMTVAAAIAILGDWTWSVPTPASTAQESDSTPHEGRVGHERELPDDTSLLGRVEALSDEVSALREEVARLRTEARRDEKANEPELTPEEQKASWDDHMTMVEAGFNDEPTDARWAGDTSSLIQRALSSEPPLHAAVKSTECRSQTCRVELNTDAKGELSEAISSLTFAVGEQLPSVSVDRMDAPGGRQTQVLYFSRLRESPEEASTTQ